MLDVLKIKNSLAYLILMYEQVNKHWDFLNCNNIEMLNFPARRVLCPSHKPPTGWQQNLPKSRKNCSIWRIRTLSSKSVALLDSATATMRGARRCGVPVSWRRRWGRSTRLGIADMCLMRRRGCTICGVGIIMRNGAGLLMRTALWVVICFATATILLLIC